MAGGRVQLEKLTQISSKVVLPRVIEFRTNQCNHLAIAGLSWSHRRTWLHNALIFLPATLAILLLLWSQDVAFAQKVSSDDNALPADATDVLPGVLDSTSLTAHSPISINGAITDITAYGIITGTGTVDDPYVIRDWRIETQDQRGITIQNTEAHIRIENVLIVNRGTGLAEGIVTSQIANLQISDVTIRGASHGIRLDLSQQVRIDRVHIINSFADGIILQGTSGFTLTNSLVQYTRYHGVAIHGPSSGAYVANNEIAYAGYYLGAGSSGCEGIIAYTEVSNLTFVDNIVHHGAEDGIEIVHVTGGVVSHNISHDNADEGFDIYFSHNNLVTGNRAFNNGGEGIVLTSATGNYVVGNLVDRNSIGYHFINANDLLVEDNVLWGPAPKQNAQDVALPADSLSRNTVFFAGTESGAEFPRLVMSPPTISDARLLPPIRYEFGTQPYSGDQLWMYATGADGRQLWSNTEQHMMIGVVITSTQSLGFSTEDYYAPNIIDVRTDHNQPVLFEVEGKDRCYGCTFLFAHNQSDLTAPGFFDGSASVNQVFSGQAQLVIAQPGIAITNVLTTNLQLTSSLPLIALDTDHSTTFTLSVSNVGPSVAPASTLSITLPAETTAQVIADGTTGFADCIASAQSLQCTGQPTLAGQALTLTMAITKQDIITLTHMSIEVLNPVADPSPASRRMVLPITSRFPLSVMGAGDGAGTITSTPAGIDCGTTCDVLLSYGESITVTAVAAPDSIFAGWDGACIGNLVDTCTITLNGATTITGTFTADKTVQSPKMDLLFLPLVRQ